jgi:hypothetical protein
LDKLKESGFVIGAAGIASCAGLAVSQKVQPRWNVAALRHSANVVRFGHAFAFSSSAATGLL